MKKCMKGFWGSLSMLVLVLALNVVAFAAEAPIPPKTPTITGWTDTTITVAAENGWEYLIWALDGTMSNWNQPSYGDGSYTFKNLKPGMGYRVYARAMATDDRKAWDLPVDDESWSAAFVVLPVTFEGVVKTPDYPRDIDEYLPAYVYAYDMTTGEEVAALLTEWNGHFKGNANGAWDQGTYKLVAYSSKNSNLRIESTITIPVTEMKEYLLSDAPAPTEAPTPAPTVAPTEAQTAVPTVAPTAAPTQAPTQKPTVAPTQASVQKPTEKATQKPTEKATQKPTEKATQKPTEKATQRPTEKATQKPTEKATQKPTEKATQKPTEKATQKPTEKITEEATTQEVTTEVVTEATEAPTEEVTEPVVATEEPTLPEPITVVPTAPVVAPVPGGNNGGNSIWLIFGVIIGIAAVAGIVFAVKKFGK